MSGEGRTVVTLVTWDIKVEGAVEDLREEDQRLLWGEWGSGYPLEKSPSHLLSPGLALRGPFSPPFSSSECSSGSRMRFGD